MEDFNPTQENPAAADDRCRVWSACTFRTFGRLDLALVAYNGGPGYAHRYASGHAVLYGETRAYVRAVLDKLRPQPLMQ